MLQRARLVRGALLGLVTVSSLACGGSTESNSKSGSKSGSTTGGAAGMAGAAGAPGCVVDSVIYAVGETFNCDCNVCTCHEAGQITSTAVACLPCLYQGVERLSGTTFPDRDGCNSCTCEIATVSCTKLDCACDPKKEWWRSYVATSAAECQALDYSCQGETKPFSNDCGCGCEEPNTCPQFAECGPRIEPARCDRILSECPYVRPAP